METSDRLADTSGDIAARGLRYTRDQFGDVISQTEDYVRANPTQSVLYALLAGYVINWLPIGRVIGGLMRLMLIALKPAILIYGAMKLYETAQRDEL